MKPFLLLAALVGSPAFSTAAEDTLPAGFSASRSVSSGHFLVHHETAFAPSGVVTTLEGHFAQIMLDLRDFAQWTGQKKIKVFVYADAASYAAKTGIPAWSAAHADVAAREIHCYESADLPRVLAHEMTHLLFTPYFSEKGAEPPAWLNEGVAKMMEWPYGQGADTGSMNRHVFSRGKAAPLRKMLDFDYHHDPSTADEVGLWYQQAASVTAYMTRRLPRTGFTAFCDALRQGKSEDESLKAAYGFQVPDVSTLERLWRESLSEK